MSTETKHLEWDRDQWRREAALWEDKAEVLRARCEQAERERDAWRQAADDWHVTNWIGTAEGLTPKEALHKALCGALDQERDELRDRLAIVERERDALKKPAQEHCSSCVDPQCWGTRQPLQLTVDAAEARITALEAHVRGLRKWFLSFQPRENQQILAETIPMLTQSLALVPDEPGGEK